MRPITRLLVLLSAFLCLPAFANDWARWRGPEQNGVSRETGLPTTWNPDTGENVVWKNNVGGMSSPIVMNGHVYTITRVGEQEMSETLIAGHKTQESVICVDAETGKTVWEYRENPTQTEVPFQPTSGKPVYCSDCFRERRSSGGGYGGGGGSSYGSRY